MNNADDDGLQQEAGAGRPVRWRGSGGRGSSSSAVAGAGRSRHVAPPRVWQPPQDADGAQHRRHSGMVQDAAAAAVATVVRRPAFEPVDSWPAAERHQRRRRSGLDQNQAQRYLPNTRSILRPISVLLLDLAFFRLGALNNTYRILVVKIYGSYN